MTEHSRTDDLERIFYQAVYAADERLRIGKYPGGDTTNFHDEAMKYVGDKLIPRLVLVEKAAQKLIKAGWPCKGKEWKELKAALERKEN